MRSEAPARTSESMEARLEAACPACGGPLEVRIHGGSAGAFCRACRRITHPWLHRRGEELLLVHPPAGLA